MLAEGEYTFGYRNIWCGRLSSMLALISLVSISLAGCGSDNHRGAVTPTPAERAYFGSLRSITSDHVQRFAALPPSDLTKLEATLASIADSADELQQFSQDLSSVSPPESVAEDHAEMIESVEEIIGIRRRMGEGMGSLSVEAIDRLLAEDTVAGDSMSAACARLSVAAEAIDHYVDLHCGSLLQIGRR